MNAKRVHWLQFHDQKTGGIMGLFPLIKDLPVRLTGHINRELALYKTTKCKIHSWKLSVNEARATVSPQVDIPPSPHPPPLPPCRRLSHNATQQTSAHETAGSARQ